MALINCPECEKEISYSAKACVKCGCPIESVRDGGTVKIKLPDIEEKTAETFSSRKATVLSITNSVLWEGEHGQTAIFDVNKPMIVIIDLGDWANLFSGRVEPGKKYNCVRDKGMQWKAAYRLSEVNVLDSD